LKKKIVVVSFINAVQAPPYIAAETQLNVHRRNDIEMFYEDGHLTVLCGDGEVIIPNGNIKAMVVASGKDKP
jgi:hypothetical protein